MLNIEGVQGLEYRALLLSTVRTCAVEPGDSDEGSFLSSPKVSATYSCVGVGVGMGVGVGVGVWCVWVCVVCGCGCGCKMWNSVCVHIHHLCAMYVRTCKHWFVHMRVSMSTVMRYTYVVSFLGPSIIATYFQCVDQ